ncbi:hypothetical protein KIW84_054552 [Lathyrus oleraceus]|uniref:Uncharacterized protein n=1 Tax=Pisum sativum TaxID=3888 RepID=A0A9D5AEN6_PEA|nr:hypothetical protein KIW84_054552 [Pisum sativum]
MEDFQIWSNSNNLMEIPYKGDYIDTGVVEDVIYNLVTSNMNNILTSLPSFEEICSAVFSLNKNNAPRPDGFEDWLHLCDNIFLPQAAIVFGAAVINTLAEIWHTRNDMKHGRNKANVENSK